LDFASEILVILDQASAPPSSSGKVKYITHSLAGDFSRQRNFALSQARGEWVLFVDDDEIVSSELAREITQVIQHDKPQAYYLPRQDVVFHQVLRHGETGQTKIVRLAHKNAGKFVRPVHEYWQTRGKVGQISSPLYHTKDHFISQFLSRMDQYSQLDAPILTREDKPFSFFRLFSYPFAKFISNYFIKAGLLDGYPGLFLSYLMSVQSLSVRVIQWTNKNSS
jgi:glycosyltransferase involved in cell wall biosynthesis